MVKIVGKKIYRTEGQAKVHVTYYYSFTENMHGYLMSCIIFLKSTGMAVNRVNN